MYNFFPGSSLGKNKEVKRAGAGVVLGWVNDPEIWQEVRDLI
jgi:hypothetical protein